MLDSDTQQPFDVAATEVGTNEDFRNDRVPFELTMSGNSRCPDIEGFDSGLCQLLQQSPADDSGGQAETPGARRDAVSASEH